MSVATLPKRAHDLIGRKKGTWTVIALDPSTRPGDVRWVIQCACGREKVMSANNWRTGSGTSTCVCQPRKPNYNQLPAGESSFRFLLETYRHTARRRGYAFELTTDEFRRLTKADCVYCGRPPSQIRKTASGTPYTYTGIDRIDTHLGYIPGNVASCCWYCNVSKHDRSLDEWKEHIGMLWERLCRP